MKEDKLPKIIALITIILFLIFVFSITPSRDEVQGLEGGNIQHAIDTKQ
jgi:hypothetical protein